ncbi:MAG: nitroreductase [Burkholderiaceae bacterium]|nr:nitroreductase [Burkholderiaceae bacterium]MCD8537055.1 nitroreductase [Burkholderiaceae bacterium]MCD8564466.1 nitroreductase [Burkholderiaceae bacterium]
MIESESQRIVDHAIVSRRSIRAFLPTPVDREDIEQILTVAARAPSGSNTQPWHVYVVTGSRLTAMSQEIVQAFLHPSPTDEYAQEYQYYPAQWSSPHIDRRRKTGLGLYKLLGLQKDDKLGMQMQQARNFKFFDAPVGMMFSIDRDMGTGSWLDFGCFLQNIMIAARARGLDTCPQAAFNAYHSIIRRHTGMPANEIFMCGMSLGYADESKIENTLITEREPVDRFARFLE